MDSNFKLSPASKIILMFIACQLLALWSGITLIDSAKIVPEMKELSVSPLADSQDPLNALFFLAYVIGGAVMALLAIRIFKTRRFFFVLEFFVLLGSVWAVSLGILHSLHVLQVDDEIVAASLIGLSVAIMKALRPSLKNIAAVLSSAGVGALFGFSAGFIPALLFALGISLYDYMAVFMTRHMLALSRALGTPDLSFTITATSSPAKTKPSPAQQTAVQSKSASRASLPDGTHLQKSQPAAVSHTPPEPDYSGVERLDLGSGDLAVPAMLSVAAYPVAGIFGSAATAIGATIGLYLTLTLVVKKRVALPAMPPISLCALLGLLIALLIAG